MLRKRIVTTSLVLAWTVAALAWAATPAAAAAASPGACHMMDASPQGITGMRGASDRGFENMIDLVLGSLDAGCSL
jgi:hypothetical protein